MTTYTRVQFATAVLQGIEAPVNSNALDALVAQQVAEGSNAVFNPADTEENEPGDSNYNPQGVKDYPSFAEGVQATVATLTNGLYGNLIEVIRQGNSSQSIANAWATSKWGTERFDPILADVVADRAKYYDQAIAGSDESEPTPEPAPVRDLAIGASGADVSALQTFLNEDCSAKLAVDGEYGELTQLSVRNFQRFFGLTVDGIVGPQTWATINYVKALHGQG